MHVCKHIEYYDESHYRKVVGAMIVKRLQNDSSSSTNTEFGVLVNAQNVHGHLEKQKEELASYLEKEKNTSPQ